MLLKKESRVRKRKKKMEWGGEKDNKGKRRIINLKEILKVMKHERNIPSCKSGMMMYMEEDKF